MDISIEPEERSPRCFDGRGSFDEDRGGPSARRQGSVRVWRRYWCRRLYELLHEARCGLEVVNHFDTLWPRTHHRLMDLQQHNMEFERSCSRNFPFSIPTPSPFSDSTVPVAFKPECTCMAVAVQNSGFDSESCRVFLHDLAAPGCFPSLLSALTENGDDGRGWASGVSNNNSELQMIYIRADISTSEEIPPSCPGWPLPIVYNKDSNDQSVVVKVQMPPRVSADRLQSDLVYLNLFL
ncbi:unnamed protein product [Phytomonas sp. Hart1]|nr:unnamed protein product [Phytomonas sp. Hart1]|eukprot:CCW70478.1 unnamed protein product [Phytomonas sp. isolate Hart1]